MTKIHLAAIHAALDLHPHDMVGRMALADLCEEQGLVAEAFCQRWMVENQKWPDCVKRKTRKSFWPRGWYWWTAAEDAPFAVIPHLVNEPWIKGCTYPSRRTAEAALALALANADIQLEG